MSIRRLTAVAASGLAMAFAAAPISALHSQAPGQGQPGWGTTPGQRTPAQGEASADSAFIRDAALANVREIRLSQVAQSKATNPSVKQFAQQMVTDHTRLQKQWATIAATNRITFQGDVRSRAEESASQLESLSGPEFDRTYMNLMIQAHQEDLNRFQYQGNSARSAQVRELVAAQLPTLQQHLSSATQIGSQVGANTTGVAVGQPGQAGQGDIRADAEFIREVASSNLKEIRLGEMAQSRAASPAVKQFGQQMVTDHTNLENQLTTMVANNGISLKQSLSSEDEEEVERLEKLSGQDFDRVYMDLMFRGHRDNVEQFQNQARSANSAQVRTFATSSLPILQQHLALAMQAGGQVTSDTAAMAAARDPNPQGNTGGNLRADAEFIRDVGADDFMQIRLAELAEKKARNREVKQFAERERADHEKLQDQWTDLVSRSDLGFKTGMGPRHKEKVDRLEKVSKKNFDRAYMTLMIQQHWAEVGYWRKEGRASRSAQVRELVDKGLPILERHFSQAKEIGRRVGVNPEAAIRNRDTAKDK
jgi:putative membrane protein